MQGMFIKQLNITFKIEFSKKSIVCCKMDLFKDLKKIF